MSHGLPFHYHDKAGVDESHGTHTPAMKIQYALAPCARVWPLSRPWTVAQRSRDVSPTHPVVDEDAPRRTTGMRSGTSVRDDGVMPTCADASVGGAAAAAVPDCPCVVMRHIEQT